MTRALLALVLASQLALGAEPVDGGLVAVPVESATLRPLDAPTTPIEVGRGVYLPEELSVSTAAKVAAYEASQATEEAAKSAPPPVAPSLVVWLVGGVALLVAGLGFAGGWAAASAARPTAAQ